MMAMYRDVPAWHELRSQYEPNAYYASDVQWPQQPQSHYPPAVYRVGQDASPPGEIKINWAEIFAGAIVGSLVTLALRKILL